MTTLLVLVPPARNATASPPPPSTRPLGRAAQALRERTGTDVVFGHSLSAPHTASGWTLHPTQDAWIPAQDVTIDVVYDRFPAYSLRDTHAQLLHQLEGLPIANPKPIARLVRDKLALQQTLTASGLEMPEVEHRPERFAEALERFGAAFLKPRFGALGRGVSRVAPGDALHALSPGPHGDEPNILQRAVPPPEGFAALALRVLVQRAPQGTWMTRTPVARTSEHDPVANVSRGARAVPAPDICAGESLQRASEQAIQAAQILATQPHGEHLVELGADFVIDPHGLPHLIELNGKPAGHLHALAAQWPERFDDEHLEACLAPMLAITSPHHQARGSR